MPEPSRARGALYYHSDELQPSGFMRFVQEDAFTRAWEKLGLGDEDLQALETAIMANPFEGDPLVGGNGLRKLRFAPERWNTGKSGGARVYYALFPANAVVVLLMIHRKNEVDELPEAIVRAIGELIDEIAGYLERR